MTYSGGTDLHPFRSEFWRVAKVNQWPEDYQTVALSAQLSGLAKSYVDSLLEEAVDSHTNGDFTLPGVKVHEFRSHGAGSIALE